VRHIDSHEISRKVLLLFGTHIKEVIVKRNILARLTVGFGILTGWVSLAGAIEFPEGVDCAMGITWEQPADHSTNFLVRVSGLDAYGLVIPVSGLKGVFTADGKLVRHVLVTRNKDEVDLWFCGTPDPVLYLGWRNADLVPGVAFHSLKSVAPALQGDAHPAGFAADVPVVPGVPGRIFRRPNWRIVDGAVRQTSSGANVYLATTPQFREGTVSLRVKPLTAQYAGFLVRGADRDSPDLNSIYWLIQSSSKTNDEGYCQVWGALTDSRPGPMLLKDQWNTLKAVLHGDTVELIINGQTAKTLSLPPTVADTGSLVLATYGGSADFDDVHVTAPDGHELFTDAFETPVIDDRRWWVTPDGRSSGGFARIVNEGTNRANCLFNLSFHRAPWAKRYAMTLSSGEASRWMWLPAWVRSVPFSINASAPNAPIRIELATDMDPGALFRKVTVPAAQRTEGFESRTLEFSNAGHVPMLSEVSRETLRAVTAMSFNGRVPERFPIGYPGGHYFDYEACRVLGFNMALLTPNTVNPDIFDKLGYKYIVTYTHLLTAIGKGVGYRQSINTNEMRLLAEHWKDTGLLDKIYRISVFDEPGHDIASSVSSNAAIKQIYQMQGDPDAWGQMMHNAGLKPEDFIDPTNPPPSGLSSSDSNFWKHVRMRTVLDREKDPQGLLNTLLLWAASYPTRFGNLRDAIHQAFGPKVLVTANVHDAHFQRGTLTDIEPWQNYSIQPALDVPQACDYYATHPQAEEFMIDLMRSSLMGRNGPVDAYLAAQASYMARPPRSLKQRAFCAIGAGAGSLSFYEYGPRYAATENWYDTDREKLRAMGEICHAIGWAEDLLLTAKPRPAPIAILYARNGDLWDLIDAGVVFSAERRSFYHLLRGLHQRADFLNDQYLPSAADLDRVKVIVMAQRCIPDSSADALLGWVKRGGTLLALGSCGQLDGLARPSSRMLKAFGLASVDAPFTVDRRAPQPLPKTIAAAHITTRGLVSTVKVDGAETSLAFDDGTPAILTRTYGRGKLVFFAFLPGHTYQDNVRFEDNLFLDMNEAVRTCVAGWLTAAGAPECATDNPLVSARLLSGPTGHVVVLVNLTGAASLPAVTVTVRGITATGGESLEHGVLKDLSIEGDVLTFRIPLNSTDMIRLQ
jgi:hypothetical protein